MAEGARELVSYDNTVMIPSELAAGQVVRDPFIGSVLASAYRIERVIGEGGMGLVYQAAHLRLDRRYAVKSIHLPLMQREDVRSRFEREARVMSRVKSDHVVDVIDVVTAADGRSCIVTELLEGMDLEQYLETSGGKLSQAEAVSLARQCLRGLSAAHALSVVHRDLKPSNLFLARDSSGKVTLKILDFGVAKVGGDSELTATGVIVGTPSYMSPEQARGASAADARSDVYAVGAVLYRMLTGQPPFEGEDPTATLIQLMQESPLRPSTLDRTIPAGLEAVIEKAMARDRNERYQNVGELDRALLPFDSQAGSALGDELGGPGHRLTDASTLTRRARLVRPAAVALASLLVLAATGAVVATLSLLVGALSTEPDLNSTELLLVMLGGAVAFVAAFLSVKRAMTPAWRNASMVQVESARFIRALTMGASVLGALELCAALYRVFVLHSLSQEPPGLSAARIGLALACASWVFLLATPRKRRR